METRERSSTPDPGRARRSPGTDADSRRVDIRRGSRARPLDFDEPARLGPRPHRGLRGPVDRASLRAARCSARSWPTSMTPSRPRAPDAATSRSCDPTRPASTSPRSRSARSTSSTNAGSATASSPSWSSVTSISTTRRCSRPSSSPSFEAYRLPRRDVAGAVGDPGLTGLELVEVPGGPCTIGAPAAGFAYDNERPRHRTDVRDYLIGRTPITNATYLTFVEGGGYERREWWSDEGWSWKEDYDITRPQSWTADHRSEWRLTGLEPLHPNRPVVHVSWFEADAFARAHGARLPTEAEWEKAATWDQERQTAAPHPWGDHPPVPGHHANLDQLGRGPAIAGSLPAGASPYGCLGMIGDVWEWTASEFDGYPGFSPFPYREYSEVFFGDGYRVLRGGSWATRPRVAGATFRNWDLPRAAPDLLRAADRAGRVHDHPPARRAGRLLAGRGRTSAPWPTTCSTASPSRSRSCSPKHLYDTRGSELFDAICRCRSTTRPVPRWRSSAPGPAEIVALTGAGELVELGAGASDKARILLDAMAAAGTLRRYIPLDVSASVVTDGRRRARPRITRRWRSTASSATSNATSSTCRRAGDATPGRAARRHDRQLPPGTRPGDPGQDRRSARRGRPPAARHRPAQGPSRDRGRLRRLRGRHRRVQPQCAARAQPRARRRLPARQLRSHRLLRPPARMDGDAPARHAGRARCSSATSISAWSSPPARSCARRSAPSSPPSGSRPTCTPRAWPRALVHRRGRAVRARAGPARSRLSATARVRGRPSRPTRGGGRARGAPSA